MNELSIEPNERRRPKLLYEQDGVLVVEKPVGIVTTPGKGHENDSLLNGLFAIAGKQLQNLGADRDFGLLNRLDRHTSGLLLAATTIHAYEALREMTRARSIGKYYWAVVRKPPPRPSAVIRKPLEEGLRNPRGDASGRMADRMKLARVSKSGKPAITAYRTLDESPLGALLECRAVTGRLHQIRVHLDSIGCTVLGDPYYGPESARGASGRLALHAHRLTLDHPVTGARVDVRSKLPRELGRLMTRLRLTRPGLVMAEGSAEAGDEVAGDPVGEDGP